MHKTPQSFHKFFLLYLSLTFISTPTYTAESQASEKRDKGVLAATHRDMVILPLKNLFKMLGEDNQSFILLDF
jgi:hypothetical protein